MLKHALLALAAAALMAGCAGQKKTTVPDTETARLPPTSSQSWQSQQMALINAREDVARAQVAVNDAQRQEDVANNEVKVADAQIDTAKSRLEAAQKARDDAAAARAQQELNYYQQKKQVAQAHVDATKKQTDAAKAQQDLAQAKQQLAELQLNQAKYQALAQANDPAAKNYSPGEFEKAISEQNDKINRLQNDARAKQDDYARANQSWQQQQQRLEASAPGTPTG